MRLATFSLANIEPILTEWVSFARTITPERDITVLRDHAAEILRAAARDMKKPQTSKQRSEKSKGDGNSGKESTSLDTALAKEMIRTTEQMDVQILDLLDFALTRLGKTIPIVTAEMNLEVLCKECVAYIQVAQPSRTIRCKLQGDLIGTWDARRLWQVISNLLANALQHGAKRKPIEFSVTGETFDVVINVHNEGKPIPKKKLTALFLPVSHLPHCSSVERPGNIGLGLYIVREIVISHVGSVHVQSSRET